MPRAFVSYSWDSDEHKAWVRDLAARLRGDGVDVTLDQWSVVPGDQLPQFMESAVRESDFVLIVCTPRYKARSDGRSGGVGYEGDIITGEVLTSRNTRKFIPILRQPPWADSAPGWLSGKYYIDLSGTPYSEVQYQDLSTTLLGKRPQAPPVGRVAASQGPASASQPSPHPTRLEPGAADEFEPIKMAGVIADQVGTPRGDGSPGSALYRVPFRLSRRPPLEWADLFVVNWDRPPRFTTMHRPGIASVIGDTVVLDGTTTEEVERYHRDTLILAAQEANRQYTELIAQRRHLEERERRRIEEHKRQVEDALKRIKFDE